MVAAREDPLVTIVIPTWNRKVLLDEAIASVAAQSYSNWELIVADDGSTDGTAEALRARGEARIRVVALVHDGNISRVRNAGAAAGSGALIAFLDSDDLWLPRKLELQVAALSEGQARWCYANYTHVDGAGAPLPDRPVSFQPQTGRILRSLLREETTAAIGTLLVERSLFDSLGGLDESLDMRGDLDFALRLAAAGDAVAVDEIVMLVRDHGARTTAGMARPHEASALVFEKFLAREGPKDLRRIARARRSRLLADAGLLRLGRGRLPGAMRLLAAAIAGGALVYVSRRLAGGLLRRGRRAPGRGSGSAGP